MRVLGIAGSPRREGNSEILLDRFLEGARSKGASAIKVVACEKKIFPCLGCGCCHAGPCPLKDEMGEILDLLRQCEVVAIAAPVYFSGLPAPLKTLIDRCQPLWVEKYLQGRVRPERKGYFFNTGARNSPDTFIGSLETAKALFFTLDLAWSGKLLAPGLDGKGEILSRPSLLEQAEKMGSNFDF
ncbi:MAG TPA: flavodoxin family protein [Cyanobacteria bacterium UBA8530]|nr:flavodoxin family protein [Cyanobacteria bacterium UBA8530]